MREKKDILIKYYQAQQLACMSYEEIGLLLILLLKEQDTDGLRFESSTERMRQRITQKENEAERMAAELPADRMALFDIAFNTINGQAEYSKQAFDRLKKSYEEKDNRIDTQALIEKARTIDRTYEITTTDGITEKFVARAKKENADNLPSEKRLQEIVDEVELMYFGMLEIFEKGNNDEWNKDIENYIPKNEREDKKDE